MGIASQKVVDIFTASCHIAFMPDRSRKRPRDPNQLAKLMVDIATGLGEATEEPKKNPAAVALGRLGGLRGGKARADSLSKERRSEIATLAARARYKKS